MNRQNGEEYFFFWNFWLSESDNSDDIARVRLQATTVQALWHWGASGLDCSWFERRLSKNQNSKKEKIFTLLACISLNCFCDLSGCRDHVLQEPLGDVGGIVGGEGGGLEHAAARLKLLSHHGCKIALCFEHLCKMTDSCPSWLSKAQVFLFLLLPFIYLYIYFYLSIFYSILACVWLFSTCAFCIYW